MKNNKKGFTLAELLIVVAIIAVLTAVAIPIFNTQLEKSREETDIANLRAAKAAAVAHYMDPDNTADMYFDAANGVLVDEANKPTVGYGKGTSADGKCADFDCGPAAADYTHATEAKDQIIKVSKNTTSTVEELIGSVDLTWVDVD